MQLRYKTGLTGEEYVRAEAWRDARLERCPNHPHGGCSLAGHGTYARKTPRGAKIARWYCPESHTTFSLLPECLAARLPGELDEVEQVVAHAEQAPSLAAAANELRRDAVELPGAMRWVERRVRLVHHVLSIVIGFAPRTPCPVHRREELDAYLTHRLRLAGCELPVFEPPAVEALFQSARGLPRLINRIAHYALIAAAVKGARTVTAEHLEHAVAELRL